MPIDSYWPLYGLRLTTPRLLLRLPSDDDLARLAELIERGIHDPAEMPFDDPPWTDAPSPAREREWVQRQWLTRGAWKASDWRLRLMAEAGDEAVGMQDLMASNFSALRSVSSYSWLGRAHQGLGYGTEMRAAVLHLAFEALGATEANSEAFADNLASIGVSRRLDYEDNGRGTMLRRGVSAPSVRFRLTRERWLASRHIPVTVGGVDPCLPLFGA
jgi:RimJ/RimL family protein N-acetyltransferase